MKTIGTLEPSYVIRKFLDAQRIHNLTAYLQVVCRLDLFGISWRAYSFSSVDNLIILCRIFGLLFPPPPLVLCRWISSRTSVIRLMFWQSAKTSWIIFLLARARNRIAQISSYESWTTLLLNPTLLKDERKNGRMEEFRLIKIWRGLSNPRNISIRRFELITGPAQRAIGGLWSYHASSQLLHQTQRRQSIGQIHRSRRGFRRRNRHSGMKCI